MALQDLVRYVAHPSAQRRNCAGLSQMAERHGWNSDEVLAILRCQKEPSRKILRELPKELLLKRNCGGFGALNAIKTWDENRDALRWYKERAPALPAEARS